MSAVLPLRRADAVHTSLHPSAECGIWLYVLAGMFCKRMHGYHYRLMLATAFYI